jgi:hypothetical protein
LDGIEKRFEVRDLERGGAAGGARDEAPARQTGREAEREGAAEQEYSQRLAPKGHQFIVGSPQSGLSIHSMRARMIY